jgi:hypothetical protein
MMYSPYQTFSEKGDGMMRKVMPDIGHRASLFFFVSDGSPLPTGGVDDWYAFGLDRMCNVV